MVTYWRGFSKKCFPPSLYSLKFTIDRTRQFIMWLIVSSCQCLSSCDWSCQGKSLCDWLCHHVNACHLTDHVKASHYVTDCVITPMLARWHSQCIARIIYCKTIYSKGSSIIITCPFKRTIFLKGVRGGPVQFENPVIAFSIKEKTYS